MTFFLPIFLKIKDRLKLIYLNGNISNKKLFLESESYFIVFLFLSIYKNNKI